MHQYHHGVLAGIASGLKVVPTHLVELLDCLLIDRLLCLAEFNGHLMDTPYVLTRNFLKCSVDHRLSKYLAENVGIIDVLRSLPDTEDRDLLGQMRIGKQGVSFLVCGYWHTEVIVILGIQLAALLISLIYPIAPGQHIVRVIIQQFELRCKFRDIISCARSGFKKLVLHSTEAIKTSLSGSSRSVGDLVAFIKYELNILVVHSYPALDLLLILTQSIECKDNEVALFDLIKVGKLLQKDVGKTVVFQYDIPVVTNRDCRGYDPRVMDVLTFHSVKSNCNSC